MVNVKIVEHQRLMVTQFLVAITPDQFAKPVVTHPVTKVVEMYKVTQIFTKGLLIGLTITETRNHAVEIGKVYKSCATKTEYKILDCVKV